MHQCNPRKLAMEGLSRTAAVSALYDQVSCLTAGFPYPISLTMWHMFFCSALAFGLVRPSFHP